jgi:biopolymer transport protein ExbD
MRQSDDDLERDLRDAFDGDDPGSAFDRKVMDQVAEGGGEVEISARGPRSSRKLGWFLLAGAAAAVLLAVFLRGVPGRGGFAGESTGEGGPNLPTARTAESFEASITISVLKNEKVIVGGKVLDWAGLKASLAKSVTEREEETRAVSSLPYWVDIPVLIAADREVRWRVIQWVMQTCADPDVRLGNLAFKVKSTDCTAALPVHLPRDRGLAIRTEAPPKLTVTLKRKRGETRTTMEVGGEEIGGGEPGFERLANRSKLFFQYTAEFTAEIHAWAMVPHGEVVRAVDILRQNGSREITFIGAPPPADEQTSEEVEVIPEEEVRPEIAEQPPISALTVNLRLDLRMRDDKPELSLPEGDTFEPLTDALPKLADRIRNLKAGGKRVTAFIECENDVPYAVLKQVLALCEKEGVSDIGMK